MTNIHPLSASESLAALTLPSAAEDGEPRVIHTAVRTVSAGYFEALGRRLRSGRVLDARDSASSAPALVVNRTFAERHLEEPAVGTRLPLNVAVGDPGDEPRERVGWEVVGVVEDARPVRLDDAGQPELFFAAAQRGDGLRIPEVSILVRTREHPEAMAPLLRSLVREQDAGLVPAWIRPMNELLGDSLAQPRLYSALVGAFAACALAVAGIGLFGLLSYTVALRRREIGLRVALGARPADVVALIARRALGLAALGLVLGMSLSFAVSRFLGRLLWGVQPHDAAGVAAVLVALSLVVALATALPARRAARIDPQRALREG